MLNRVMLIGRLGADPDVRFMPNGDQITTIRLATTRRWKDRTTNERQEETEWHRVVFFSGLAKVAGEYLKKGSQAYVSGRIRTQKWQNKEGQDQYTTEIVADEMNMLDGKRDGNTQSSSGYSGGSSGGNSDNRPQSGSGCNAPSGGYGSGADYFDDDIPFAPLHWLV